MAETAFTLSPLDPAPWAAELILAGTVLLGLATGALRRGTLTRPVTLAGLTAASVMAWSAPASVAAHPCGPHFVVDATAGPIRLAILVVTWLAVLNLPGPGRTAGPLLALAALGLILLSEAVTVAGVLLAAAMVLVGGGLAAWARVAPPDRDAVAGWSLTATAGFGLLVFAAALWSGLLGSTSFAASLAGLQWRPFLPAASLTAILACLGVGLTLVLLGEPGRFAQRPGAGPPAGLTGWLTAAPPLALAAFLLRLLQDAPPAQPFDAIARVMTGAAAVLMLGGYLAALTRRDLQRRLAWAATGQVGLALLGFSVLADGRGPLVVLPLLLVFAAAQFGACILAGVVVRLAGAPRRRFFLPVLLAGMLLALCGLPPLAGWRPRLDLLQTLVAGDRYPGAALALAGTLLACFVYLRPLVDLWRGEPEAGPDDAGLPQGSAEALLSAAALLALLLAWGAGLVALPSGVGP